MYPLRKSHRRVGGWPEGVSNFAPPSRIVEIAEKRTAEFVQMWARQYHSNGGDIGVLVRSAYIQGLNDMADSAARMMAAPPIDWDTFELEV